MDVRSEGSAEVYNTMVSINVCVYVANIGTTSSIHTLIYGHKYIRKLILK